MGKCGRRRVFVGVLGKALKWQECKDFANLVFGLSERETKQKKEDLAST